ncbi:MAG: DUF192 domain-containing protein [Chloroflexi bacterium]|nr:DUF192 domain-containing protein [Chloroflexota bacterium]
MRVFNQTRNLPLVTQGRVANTFWLRLRGLLGVASLRDEEGLILVGEKSIHTLFMRFPIDVVYVDKSYKVIRADINMVPYRLGPFVVQSAYVVEMPIGIIANTATEVGDQLKFED